MNNSKHEKKEVLLAVLLNLSALSYYPLIWLGIIIPLVFWIFTKNKYSTVNEVGRRLLNFQICWCLLILYIFAIMYLIPKFNLKIGNPNAQLLLVFEFLYVMNALFIMINSIRCYLGKEVFYPALRFIK
ncbi:DUF4870 domain-containing protein [Pedobacter sp. L105]|uniref:DUF4870 domain-containing protein n=1 Tax=Pedobacter sp. L105 TaxID=1641871 RepID=UPI00131C5703